MKPSWDQRASALGLGFVLTHSRRAGKPIHAQPHPLASFFPRHLGSFWASLRSHRGSDGAIGGVHGASAKVASTPDVLAGSRIYP